MRQMSSTTRIVKPRALRAPAVLLAAAVLVALGTLHAQGMNPSYFADMPTVSST